MPSPPAESPAPRSSSPPHPSPVRDPLEGTEPLLKGSTAPTSQALHAVRPRRSRAGPRVLPAEQRAAQREGSEQTCGEDHKPLVHGSPPSWRRHPRSRSWNAQPHARLGWAGALRSLHPSRRGRALVKARVNDGGRGGPQNGEGAPRTLPTPQLPTDVCTCTFFLMI